MLLLALRWYLAGRVGFGDAEALYAAYALHPQPAYLDHPGLIGSIARAIGDGSAPTPRAAHRFTAVVATLIPWIGALAARGCGATRERALTTFFALAFAPEIAVGLFALTPDLPLAVLWLGALGLAGLALRNDPGSRLSLVGAVGAGFCTGLAITAKVTGVLLLAALAATFAGRPARRHLRHAGPWCGLVAVLILIAPFVHWEWQQGWPLLRHRLVATQGAAGFSLRNLGALAGGQLLYVTPPFLLAAWRVLRALSPREDAVDRLLIAATVVPAVPLGILCLWSRVAEPHWLAPAYLAAALAASRAPEVLGRSLKIACAAVGALAVLAGFLVAGTPLVPRYAGAGYVPKYDLSNDLHAWQVGLPVLREQLEALSEQGLEPVIVAPHWTLCAQIDAGLRASVPIVCRTPHGDDFAGWYPGALKAGTRALLYVSDDRFPGDAAHEFPDRKLVEVQSAKVYRGGRLVRTIRIARLDRAGMASRDP